MTTPSFSQLSDPTQSGPGFPAQSPYARMLTIASMLATGQNPDGTANGAVPFINAKTFGAAGDGVTDDSAALQAAINATPQGGLLFIPPTTPGYKFGTGLTISRSIQIVGGGWAGTVQAVYGNAGWNIGAGINNGSILYYTGTGSAIQAIHANLYERILLRDFAIFGPGTAGSTGLNVGTLPNSHITIGSRIDNVMVGNFDIGVLFATEDTLFIDLGIGGCNTVGFHGVAGWDTNGFNNNSFINCKFQTCNTIACQLTGGTQTGFYSPLFQANTGTSLRLEGVTQGVWIEGSPYFENSAGTHALDLNSASACRFSNLHCSFGSTTDNINMVSSVNNTFDWPAQSNIKVTADAASSSNWFIGNWSGASVTDASNSNFFLISGTANGALDVRTTQSTQQVMSWGPFSGPLWGLWNGGSQILLRDLANARYHMLLTGGAGNAAATSEFLSEVQVDGRLKALTGGANISSGSGAPSKPNTINPTAGDIYFRTDTPSTANQRIYICTVGGGTPTWVGIV